MSMNFVGHATLLKWVIFENSLAKTILSHSNFTQGKIQSFSTPYEQLCPQIRARP